jgi:tryptophan 2,3-dioxygenase
MDSQRDLEKEAVVDLQGKLDYSDYLHVEQLVACQHPLSDEHDEMLFIIQHQVSELWMKLVIHELRAAIEFVQKDDLEPCFKIIARVKHIIWQLFQQWAVLETLTPSEYVKFRHVLGPASGMQSLQYRTIEFLLGNKDAKMIRPFSHKPELYEGIKADLEAPSLYDEFILHLGRRGFEIPEGYAETDFCKPHESDERLTNLFFKFYYEPGNYWSEYEMAEKLIDVDAQIAQWRFRHMKTVERVIGFKRGTGGTAGVPWLQKVIFVRLFPELWDVRNLLEEPGS